VACLAPVGSAAAAEQVLLPGSRAPTASPPLTGQAVVLETRFRRPIPSSERVLVGIDRDGTPVSVDVVQRLVVVRTGDYTFAVVGPVEDVVRAPGSESDPGLRRDAVLWAGFSPGRRVLAARVTLDVGRARAFLPLRIAVTRSGGRIVLRLQNVTGIRVPAFEADADAGSVAPALDATRAAASADGPLLDAFANVRAVRTTLVTTAAPLRVTGRFGTKQFSTLLGDGRPLQYEVSLPAGARVPRVQLSVEPVPPVRGLTPPNGRTWASVKGLPGRALLARAVATRLEFARARQYDQFLAVPDQAATARAVYEYRTVARTTATAPPAASPSEEGTSAAVKLAVALAAVALLAGGLVWWANS
jgi:hypothetical protein